MREELGGRCLVLDVGGALKGLPVPIGLGFPFPTLGGAQRCGPSLKGRTKGQGLQLDS